MIVKKYTGNSDTEAIIKAKEDLGPTAVVLNVRTMKQRGLARLFKKDYVEITAALEEKEFASNVNAKKPSFSNSSEKQSGDVNSKIDLKADEPTIDAVNGKTTARPAETIEKKLDSLHDMLKNQMVKEEISEKAASAEDDNKTKNENSANFKSLKLIYNKLLENEVDEKYANLIINDIENSLKKESNLDSILASVYQKIILKLGEPAVLEDDGRRKAVFFIGPTGVGKTTTIAKLASDFKLNRKKKIAMVTADTYRIAAVEQLNTYAGILDVPVNVVYAPSEMEGAIKDFENYEYLFIDTAGRSHKNKEQRDEIIEMINLVKKADFDLDIIIFLVISVTTKYKDVIEICDAYKELENYRLLFTKLDETSSLGNILNIRMYTNAQLSYTTYGQNVPDDIECADVQKLAKNLLGGE